METIKYEAVFGDQSLFTQDETEIIYKCDKGSITEASLKFLGKSIDNGGIIAIRRIIKTPVWTRADKNAGRLPEVGSKCHYCNEISTPKTVIAVTKTHIILDSETPLGPDVLQYDYFFQYYIPIETQEERAQRLRDEWCFEVRSMSKGELYDALLSGELQSPKDLK